MNRQNLLTHPKSCQTSSALCVCSSAYCLLSNPTFPPTSPCRAGAWHCSTMCWQTAAQACATTTGAASWIRTSGIASASRDGAAWDVTSPPRRSAQTARTMREVWRLTGSSWSPKSHFGLVCMVQMRNGWMNLPSSDLIPEATFTLTNSLKLPHQRY